MTQTMAPARAARRVRGTGFALRDPLPWEEFAGLARSGEHLGYAGVFLPEITGRDAFVALAALAGETRHLLLGTGIVPMRSRDPLVTAMAAASVQERSGGRAIVGIGTGPSAPGALDELGRRVRGLRALLAGESIVHEGRRISLSLAPGSPPPIWVSALGPKAVRLAGEVADGVLLNWCTPDRVSQARAAVRQAAEHAGREPDEIVVAAYIRAGVGEGDLSAVLGALRAVAGEYASYPAYARQFDAMGLGGQARAAASAHRAGRSSDAADELVRAVCVVGDVDSGRARLDAFREAGADLPIVYPVRGSPTEAGSLRATLEALTPA